MVREKNIERFKDLLDHYEYKKAAKMYYNSSFEGTWIDFYKILNERNCKNKVIDIMYDEFILIP